MKAYINATDKDVEVRRFVFDSDFIDTIIKLNKLGINGDYGELDLLVGRYISNKLDLNMSHLGTDWDYESGIPRSNKATVYIYKKQ
jgi:hypothetical protein